MVTRPDEADEPMLGAERTGKAHLEPPRARKNGMTGRDGWRWRLTVISHLMKNASKTIRKRLYGILNVIRHGVSNGNAEALNIKIRRLRIKASGYRNREYFKLGVMFHYGKLYMTF